MKTFLASCAVLISLAPALRAQDNAQLQTFATCAGRLSAVMEHQWMFDGDASEQTKAQRATVLELISAIMEPDMGRQVLHWRLTGKQAHNVLLTRATFNQDASDAIWAREQATLYERECTGLLLS
ncbi:hypothetical protein MWU60_00335 [Yoonia sp. F2084L]|uniref:hypothetical protein n=1 Tax=Yoonia sp. F2084L TaxID=2926419 RepID=UPI001FF137B3|nr:hypothetical protein [Yoonia sp. F2084L]MCK0094000.1 hypothetical protein [Yoonia sp. F2084L]